MEFDITGLTELIEDNALIIGIATVVVIVLTVFLVLFLNRKKKALPQQQEDMTVQQPGPMFPMQAPPPPIPDSEATVLETPTYHQPLMPPDLGIQPQPQPDYRPGTVAIQTESRNGREDTGFRLTALSGPLKGRSFPIPAKGVVIGRDPSRCDIPFSPDTRGVSSTHCRVGTDHQGTAILIDLRSTYGTYLTDGRRLTPGLAVPIQNGQIFLLAGLDGPAFRLEMQ